LFELIVSNSLRGFTFTTMKVVVIPTERYERYICNPTKVVDTANNKIARLKVAAEKKRLDRWEHLQLLHAKTRRYVSLQMIQRLWIFKSSSFSVDIWYTTSFPPFRPALSTSTPRSSMGVTATSSYQLRTIWNLMLIPTAKNASSKKPTMFWTTRSCPNGESLFQLLFILFLRF
jgi:hypothetical protein